MSDVYIDVHGLSHHFSDGDYQERNVGGGVRWEEQSNGKRMMGVIGGYLNSLDRVSLYIAVGAKWPVAKHVEVGAIVGAVSGYNDGVMPAAMPVVSIGGDRARVNVMGVPEVEGVTSATVMISTQFRID